MMGMRMRRGNGLIAAMIGAVLLATISAPSASAADWNGRLVLDQGHLDAIHMELSGNALSMNLREDITGNKVIRPASSVVIHVTDAAKAKVPADPAYRFLGSPGTDFWLIPQVQNPDVVWAGWDTEEIEKGQLRGDSLTLRLSGVAGPGAAVKLYSTGTFGQPVPMIDSLAGLLDITVPANAHVHANWAFSAPGVYDLTFAASAVTAAGVSVAGSATYQFVVGDLPSTTNPVPTPTVSTPTDPPPIDPPVGGNSVSQSIRASIAQGDGGLVLSVDPKDRSVVLPAASLAPSGGYWMSRGELRPVTVTDTRSGSPGWNVVGRVGSFSGSAGEFGGEYLGWKPVVSKQTADRAVVAGVAVVPGLRSGEGLGRSATLGSAPAGSGRGVAVLGAGLELNLPAATEAGTYDATLTLTVI